MTNQRLLLYIAGGFVLFFGLAVYLGITTTPQNDGPEITTPTVTLIAPEGLKGELYVGEDEHGTAKNGKLLQTVEGTKKVKLTSGTYRFVSQITDTYAEGLVNFTVENKPVTIKLDPDYSEKKLKSLLSSEASKILAAIARDTPDVPKFYSTEPGWLYQKGDWYATKLKYKGPSLYDADTLLLVARKENGAWKVVTKPPQITVSRILYPEIPEDVAKDINNFR